jgi:hypothetical protein
MISIVMNEEAAEAAEMFSTPAIVAAQARREIARRFGQRFRFRRFDRAALDVRVYFSTGGVRYVAHPIGECEWAVDTGDWRPVCPPYPLLFTDRAAALIHNMGWNPQHVEMRARCALNAAEEADYGFCDFRVPIEEVPFVGKLNKLDTVEIDLDDWWREHCV